MGGELILLILKWIGIALLFLLGIALTLLVIGILLLILLLFVPFRYRAKIIYGKKGLKTQAEVSFLFRIFRFSLTYEQTLVYQCKLFFFTLFSSLKKRKKKKKREKRGKRKESEKKSEKKKEETIRNVNEDTGSEKKDTLQGKEKLSETAPLETKTPEESSKMIESEKISDPREEREQKNTFVFFEKIEEKWEKVTNFTEKTVEKSENFKKNYEDWMRKKDVILDFINSDGTVDAMKLLFSESFHLIRAILPKKWEGKIRFGTGDVYTEGQYLTYLCLIYGFYAEQLVIEPEWEEKVFETDVFLVGRIRLFTIVRICIKVYFNSNFQKFRDHVDFLKTRLGL